MEAGIAAVLSRFPRIGVDNVDNVLLDLVQVVGKHEHPQDAWTLVNVLMNAQDGLLEVFLTADSKLFRRLRHPQL